MKRKHVFTRIICVMAAFTIMSGGLLHDPVFPDIPCAYAIGVVAEGKCGANLTYLLDSDMTLTISGTGDMYENKSKSEKEIKWSKYKNDIKKIIVENGVTSLCYGAFSGCNAAESISLPDTLTAIGQTAFSGLESIKELTIPEAVTGDFCASKMLSLESLTLPSKLQYVRLANCPKLKTLIPPDGSEDNSVSMIIKDCETLQNMSIPKYLDSIAVSNADLLTDHIMIPDKTKTVALDNAGRMKRISVPDSVTVLSVRKCSYLTEVNVPAELISGCEMKDGSKVNSGIANNAGLESVSCSDALHLPEITVCKSLKSIYAPKAVDIMGSFSRCGSLSEVYLPEVQKINSDAFSYCTALTEIDLPKVECIRSYAFMGCTSLTKVSASSAEGIENYAFSGCNSLETVAIPLATSIGYYAFQDCAELKSVCFPDLKTVKEYAFDGCVFLSDIILSETKLETIGAKAFEGTPWLEEQRKTEPLVILNHILIDGQACSNTVEIPNQIKIIAPSAFSNNPKIITVYVPESVEEIGEHAFDSCTGLRYIRIENTKCKIPLSNSTINSGYLDSKIIYDGVICGYTDSTAEKYAKKFGYGFETIGYSTIATIPDTPATSTVASTAKSQMTSSFVSSTSKTTATSTTIKSDKTTAPVITKKVPENDFFVMDDSAGNPGETVPVTIRIKTEIPWGQTGFRIYYDSRLVPVYQTKNDKMTIKYKTDLPQQSFCISAIANEEKHIIGANIAMKEDVNDEVYITFYFVIPENAETGTQYSLSLELVDLNDIKNNKITSSMTVINGTVSVSGGTDFGETSASTTTTTTIVTVSKNTPDNNYFVINDCMGIPGETILVTVRFKTEIPWASVGFRMHYDDRLIPVYETNNGEMTLKYKANCTNPFLIVNEEKQLIGISIIGGNGVNDESYIAMYFKIPDNAQPETQYQCSLELDKVFDLKSNKITSPMTMINGTVSVSGSTDIVQTSASTTTSTTTPKTTTATTTTTTTTTTTATTTTMTSTTTTTTTTEFTGASGICGTNLTWTIDKSGTLTISGKGEMKPDTSYGYMNYAYICAPWQDYFNVIKKAVIEDGITSICEYAFSENYGPMPGGAEYVEPTIAMLESITIPNSVRSIGESAFCNCKYLKEISLPDSITTIEEYAFSGCCSIKSISIPRNLKIIQNGLFSGCSSLQNVTIGNAAETIGYAAFSVCDSLTDIIIPENVKEIGEYAFDSCNALEEINIPGSVKEISKSAFYNCSGLKKLYVSDGVETIGEAAFLSCTSLADVRLPESVTDIEYQAFADTPWIQKQADSSSLVIVNHILLDGQNCTEDIVIPDGVKKIGTRAFYECSDLTSVMIPDGVTEIKDQAFFSCRNLSNVQIPDSVSKIGQSAFFDCTNLISVNIPYGIEAIESGVFNSCSNLTNIIIPNSVKQIESLAFSYCKGLIAVNIPKGVTSIGREAFAYCSALKNIHFPDTVEMIETDAFASTPWLEAKRAENPLVIVNHIVLDGQKCKGEVTVPDGIEVICENAFSAASEMSSIHLPDSLTTIGSRAFAYTFALKNIEIPGSVSKIESSVFYNSGLESITLPEGIISIGWEAFSGCKKLTEITLPESLTTIANRAFYRCNNLNEIILPAGVSTIQYHAFEDCSGLTKITILNPVCEIGNDYKTLNGTIYGYSGSTAEEYAQRYNRTFVSLGDAPKTVQSGDINQDGTVSIADAVLLCRYVNEDSTLDESAAKKVTMQNADLDDDNEITVLDVTKLLYQIAHT